MRAYGGDLDLPAYNFTAADLGMVRTDRDQAMAWLARVLLGLIPIVVDMLASFEPRRPAIPNLDFGEAPLRPASEEPG